MEGASNITETFVDILLGAKYQLFSSGVRTGGQHTGLKETLVNLIDEQVVTDNQQVVGEQQTKLQTMMGRGDKQGHMVNGTARTCVAIAKDADNQGKVSGLLALRKLSLPHPNPTPLKGMIFLTVQSSLVSLEKALLKY